ncbi:MAG: hypothetical protein ABIV27_04900, partial [Gemmatimonadales bacterium]
MQYLNVVLLAVILIACARDVTPKPPAEAPSGQVVDTIQGKLPTSAAKVVITPAAMGPIRLGLTLAEARAAVPSASFLRTTDGDGVALVTISAAEGVEVVAWAGEDDSEAPIDWSKPIQRLETFNQALHTAEGVRVGLPVDDVVRLFGPLVEIVTTEIESRQFITFKNQPDGMTLRLDYTGIFAPGETTTMRYQPSAKI